MKPFALLKAAVSSGAPETDSGDVREVETIIALLLRAIEDEWRRRTSYAVVRLHEIMRGFDDRLPTAAIDDVALAGVLDITAPKDNHHGKGHALLAAKDYEDALWAALLAAFDGPLPRALGIMARDGGASLLGDGYLHATRTVSPPGTPLSLSKPIARLPNLRVGLLPLRSEQDVTAMLLGRVTQHETEIRAHLRKWITDPELRGGPGTGPAPYEWTQDLYRLLGEKAHGWLPQVLDSWTYRWYSIGRFLALSEDGIVLVAWNPRDSRTTAFCWWVHGKVISWDRAAKQVRDFLDAVAAGDTAAMIATWPMLHFDRGDGAHEFSEQFQMVGLPPYHWRCRTIAQPHSIARAA